MRRAPALVTAVVLGVGLLLAACTAGRPIAAPARSTPSRAPVRPPVPLQAPVAPSAPPAGAAAPVRVQMPRLHIDSRLDDLGVTKHGELATPASFTRAAWFSGGIRPGDTGPAVIVGHVDSTRGPAVFYDLRRARSGDEIKVTDAAHVTRRFTVTGVRRYPKTTFGTSDVYGPTATPTLRLITCTGSFDRSARSYRDNLVVFAALPQPRAG